MISLIADNRDYRRYLAGTVVSISGSSLTDSIWPILTYWVTGSPIVTALTTLIQVLPHLIIGLLAGVQVDRASSKRNFLIVPNLLSGAVFLMASLIGADGYSALMFSLLCYFISECAAIYYSAAIPVVLPRIVSKNSLASARSIVSVIVDVSTFVLPGAAVFVLSRFGARPLFLANAISFFAAAYFLARISLSVTGVRAVDGPEIMSNKNPCDAGERGDSDNMDELLQSDSRIDDKRELLDKCGKEGRVRACFSMLREIYLEISSGVRYLWNEPTVRSLTLAGALNAACGGVVLTLYVVLLNRSLGFSNSDYRLTFFVYAITVGGILGALLLPPLKRFWSPLRVAVVAFFCSSISATIFTFSTIVPLSIFAICFYQASYSLIIMNAIVLRMEVVADEYMGRVSATGRLISWGAAPVGALFGGVLIDGGVSVIRVFGVAAILPMIGAIFLHVSHSRSVGSS